MSATGCGQLWIQENRRTTTRTAIPGMRMSKEEGALSGIADALTWRHALEENDYEQNPNHMWSGHRVIAYPDFLSKLGLVLTTRNFGMDPCEASWPEYEAILIQSDSWNDEGRPRVIHASSKGRKRAARLKTGWRKRRRSQWQGTEWGRVPKSS